MAKKRLIALLIALNIILVGVVLVQQCHLAGRTTMSAGALLRPADARTASVFAADPSENPIVAAANLVSPAVVAVGGKISRVTYYVDPFFEGFFWPYFARPAEQRIEVPFLGSGILIDGEGHLVTNVHVVERVVDPFVTLNDGRRVAAQLLDKDNRVDVALLKADLKKPPFATMGDSDSL
ncbi:hypothetical protein AMJ85_06680, partial [candidate division BRC1 bacterium SM23_51]